MEAHSEGPANNKEQANDPNAQPEEQKQAEESQKSSIPDELKQQAKDLAQEQEKPEAEEQQPTAAPQKTPEEEIATLKDQVLRALAEAENTKRRAVKDVEEARKYSISGIARELLEVQENLHRAKDNLTPEMIEANEVLKTVADGIEMTKRSLQQAFEKHGIKRIDPLGEKFDHNFHQAVTQVPDDSKEEGTIVHVIQAGYVIHDRLLRPAMVTVAKKSDSSS